jgi:hypothetical protein
VADAMGGGVCSCLKCRHVALRGFSALEPAREEFLCADALSAGEETGDSGGAHDLLALACAGESLYLYPEAVLVN